MPHTYSKLLAHLVWCTKERAPIIVPEIRDRLHAYIGGIVREESGTAIAVGGVADHVHALLELPADKCVADCVRVVKANSSRWIHETWSERRMFSWQAGYAAFAVSPSMQSQVVAYIAGQEEHHRRVSFHDEFVSLLQKHGIPVDERFLWT